MKGIGHLEDIFMGTHPVKHNRVHNPYMACTQVDTYHCDKQEDKMPDQQNKGADFGKHPLLSGLQ